MKKFVFFLNLFLFSFSTNAMDLSATSNKSLEDDKYYEKIEILSSIFSDNLSESSEELGLGNEFNVDNIYKKIIVEQERQIKAENDKNGYYSTISEISAWLDKYGIRLSFALPNQNKSLEPKFSRANGNVRSNSTNFRRSKFNSVFISSSPNRHPHRKSVVGKLRRQTIAVRDLLIQDDEKIDIDSDDLNNLCQALYRSGCWPLELTGNFLKILLESWGDLTDESQTFAICLSCFYRAILLKSNKEDPLNAFRKISLDESLIDGLNRCRSIVPLTYKFVLAFLQKVIDKVDSFNRMKRGGKQKKNKGSLENVDFLDPITLSMEFTLDGPLKEVLLTFFRRFSSLKENLEKHEYLYLFSNPFFVKILSVYDDYLQYEEQVEVVEILYGKLLYSFSTWEQLTTLLKQGVNYSDEVYNSLYNLLKFYDLGGIERENFLRIELEKIEKFFIELVGVASVISVSDEQVNFLLEVMNKDGQKFASLKEVYDGLFERELRKMFLQDETDLFFIMNHFYVKNINNILEEIFIDNLFNRCEAMDFYETIERFFLKIFIEEEVGGIFSNKKNRLVFLINRMEEARENIIPKLELENISGDKMKAKLALAFVLLKKGDENSNVLARRLLEDIDILDIDAVDGIFDSEDKDIYVYGELTNNNDWLVLSSLLKCFNTRGECTVSLQKFNEIYNDLFIELSNKKRLSFFELSLFNILSSKSVGYFIEKLEKRGSKKGKKRKKKRKNIKQISFSEYSALCELKKYLLSQSFDVFIDYCLGD